MTPSDQDRPHPDVLARLERRLALLAGIALVLWVLARIRRLLLLLVASTWLAYAVAPLARLLGGRRHQLLGILLAHAVVLVVVGIMAVGAVVPALREGRALAASLPGYAHRLARWGADGPGTMTSLPAPLRVLVAQEVQSLLGGLQAAGLGVAARSLGLVLSFTELVVGAVLMVVLSILILTDRAYVKEQFFHLVPAPHRPTVARLLAEMDAALAASVRGQLLIAALVGAVFVPTLLALGANYPLFLGMLAGAAQLVPEVGPAVGLLVVVGMTALQSLWLGARVLLAFAVVYLVVGRIVAPWAMGRAVRMHPLVVVIVTLAGLLLGGIVGGLVAVPLAAVARVLLVFAYTRLAPRWGLDQ